MSDKHDERRKHPRKKPDSNALAHFDIKNDSEAFRAELIGLVANESPGGCAVATLKYEGLELHKEVRIKPGQLNPIRAKVVWHTELDSDIIKIGLQYEE